MDRRMLLLAAVAFLAAPGARSRSLTGTVYSIHKDSRTWNEARAICEADGGQLAKFNRNASFDALIAYRYSEGDLWMVNIKKDIWIGLHSPAANNKYRWANCEPLTSDHWTSPGRVESGSELCVVAGRDTCTWEPEQCRERHQYVCEEKTGPCKYTLTSGHCDDGAEARLSVEVENQTECQELCDSETKAGLPCWMFVYDSPDCWLFFASIPWQCGASTSNTSATVGIRSCFKFRFHESTTTIPDDESNFPITSCDVNSTTATSTTQSGLNDTQSVHPAATTTYSSTPATSPAAQNSNALGKATGDDPDTTQTITQPTTRATSQAAQNSNALGKAPEDDPDTTQTITQPTTRATSQAAQNSNALGKAPEDDPDTTQTTTQPAITATPQPTSTTTSRLPTTTTPQPTTTTIPQPTTTTTPPSTTTTTTQPTTTRTTQPTTTTIPQPTTTTIPQPTTTTTPQPTKTTTTPSTTTTTSQPTKTTIFQPTTTTTTPSTTTTTSQPTTTTNPPSTTTTTPQPTTTTTFQPTTTTTPPSTTTTTTQPTTTTAPQPTTTTTPPSTTTTTSQPTTTTTPPSTTTTTSQLTTTTTPPSTTTTTSQPTTTTTPPSTTTTTPPSTTTTTPPFTTTTTTQPTTTHSTVAHGLPAASQIDVDNKTSDNCPCEMCVKVKNSTEIQGVIDELRVWLKVDQSTLSAVRRKRVSQTDDRPSATIIGYSGIVFITAVMSVFIISDTLTLCQQLAKKR